MLYEGDARKVLLRLPEASVDAVVTDPPYGLSREPDAREVLTHWLAGDDYKSTGGGFMGKSWDSFVPGPATWREVLRVLKPGGHALVFAGSRTQDLMTMALRLAGFEIRDCLMWLYGSGFPKSLDIAKAVDKRLGFDREIVGRMGAWAGSVYGLGHRGGLRSGKPKTDESAAWSGWGTALKPAYEPIILARKPPSGTIADNILEHGTGALNIAACRVGITGGTTRSHQASYAESGWRTGHQILKLNAGRWPANVLHDGCLRGAPSRYFYTTKADARDRDAGLFDEAFKSSLDITGRKEARPGSKHPRAGRRGRMYKNTHPTVKPTDLMCWLVRLITPPGGTVLDPFMGSGSTGRAAAYEGFNFVGIDLESEYVRLAEKRIRHALRTSARRRVSRQ